MRWADTTETEQRVIKRWQLSMLLVALVCEIFLAADWYAFAAVIPFISKSLHLNEEQAGFAQGIFALTYGIGMVLWSPVSRTMSARTMLLIGLAGTGLGMALQVFVQNYSQLVTVRLFIGFFDAAIFIANMKLIFGWYPQERRGSIVGLILAAYSLAITLDFAVGIPVTMATSWQIYFGVLAAGTLIVAVVVIAMAKNDPREIGMANFSWDDLIVAHATLRVGEIFRSRWIAIGALSICAAIFALSGTATWVVPGFISKQNMPVEYAPIIGTLMGVSQIVFLVIGGYVSDKAEKMLIIKLSVAFAVVVALLFAGSMIYPTSFGVLILLSCVSGAAVFGGGATFSLMTEKYSIALAPVAIGYSEVVGVIATFLAPWMMGSVIHANSGSFYEAFLLFAGVELVFLFCLVALTWRQTSLVIKQVPAS